MTKINIIFQMPRFDFSVLGSNLKFPGNSILGDYPDFLAFGILLMTTLAIISGAKVSHLVSFVYKYEREKDRERGEGERERAVHLLYANSEALMRLELIIPIIVGYLVRLRRVACSSRMIKIILQEIDERSENTQTDGKTSRTAPVSYKVWFKTGLIGKKQYRNY